EPIIEFYLKDDELGDPLIIEDHIRFLKIASSEEMEQIKKMALKVNQFLISLFDSLNIRLIDFKLEFGKDPQGQILLADEISPDTCRLWEKETNRKLDKDVFRRNLGNLIDAYTEVLTRLGGKTHV
ncbi:phosphoribosylaminoimidazolesuccinocarboxamide synthase, partial [Geobacillus sp. NFOSA3]|nr:phosphoribosylaminoimidazolesuccinocarboxamide synthase [Geobacillus sp. NFOSA3]